MDSCTNANIGDSTQRYNLPQWYQIFKSYFQHRTCGDVCPTVVPTSCQDCITLGPKCCGKYAKECKKMGWKQKKNTCKRGTGEKCQKKCKTCEGRFQNCIMTESVITDFSRTNLNWLKSEF